MSTLNYPTDLPEQAAKAAALLSNPLLVARRMFDVTKQRFIADQIFGGRAHAPTGTVAYEMDEPVFPEEPSRPVAPGAVIPTIMMQTGEPVSSAIGKSALGTSITVEAVRSLAFNPVDRALRTLGNGLIRDFDLKGMAQIDAVKTKIPTVVGTDWTGLTDTKPIRQIMQACEAISELGMGYLADTIVLDSARYIELMSNEKMLTTLAKYLDGEVAVGTGPTILTPSGDLKILKTPAGVKMDVMVLDSGAFGFVASTGQDNTDTYGVVVDVKYYGQSEVSPAGQSEAFHVTVKRDRKAFAQNPKAAVMITGTAG